MAKTLVAKVKGHFISNLKVQLFWEGHKNLVQTSSRFWCYLVMSKPWGRLHQIFVAFSEKLNFTSTDWLETKVNEIHAACTQMVSFVFISLSFNKCTVLAVHTVMFHCLCVTLTKNAQLTPILSIHCSTWTWNNTYASNNISIFFFLGFIFCMCSFFIICQNRKRHYDCPRYFFCQLCKPDFYCWLKKWPLC